MAAIRTLATFHTATAENFSVSTKSFKPIAQNVGLPMLLERLVGELPKAYQIDQRLSTRSVRLSLLLQAHTQRRIVERTD